MILASGALFGIWLGAYYAAGRLGAQLDEQARWFNERRVEESKRLERQLNAESQRLDRQLEHDRLMRDREELRKILDELAKGLMRAAEAIIKLRNSVPGLARGDEVVDSVSRQKAKLDARKLAYELLFEVQRLNLRFGLDHPVTSTFMEARLSMVGFLEEIDVERVEWTEEQREGVELKKKVSAQKTAAFIEASRRYTDVELP